MRRDMVTRTVLGTNATLKVVELATDSITEVEIKLGKKYELGTKELEKAVRKALDPAKYVLVAIIKVEECNKLYGLDTAKFMEMAVELDPKTRGIIKDDSETEEE